MREPYEMRFHDAPIADIPLMTHAAERHYEKGSSVRFAAGGGYRLLVSQNEQGSADDPACLLRPGQTVLFSFESDRVLCDVGFQGGDPERFFHLPKRSPAYFSLEQPNRIFDAALAALQVPEGCSETVYRSGVLLQILSFLPGEEAAQTDNCGKRAMQYIRENYMRPINVGDIASAMGVSRSWLYRCFMDYAEQSPAMFLRDVRLQRAKSLLLRTSLSVQQIAQAVGYEDPLYFSRVFSEYIGCAPSAYRKAHEN